MFNHNLLYSQYNFKTIKAEYAKGNLSHQQYLEYSALNFFEPARVPQEYRLSSENLPLKSGTLLIQEIKTNWDKISPNVQKILAKYLQRPELNFSVLSPNGLFRIHYNKTGYDAVDLTDDNKNGIPDYVDSTIVYLEYAHHLIVDSLGYNTHPPDYRGIGNELDVYIHNISAYGFTTPEDLVTGSSVSYTSYIEIENDFAGPGFRTPRYQSLQVTTAHEYFHSVQVGYAFRCEDIFFMEMCSTWMEDFAHDDVNDYILYLPYFFNHANYPFSYQDQYYEYGSALWNHMIVKKYDPYLFRKVWENMPHENAMTSIREVLPGYNTTFNKELASFGLWNYFTKNLSDVVNFYPEGDLYPEIHFAQEYTINGNDVSFDGNMSKLSSTYYLISDITNNLTIGLIVTNFETPTKDKIHNYDPADKADFSIDLISLSSEEPPGDADFFLKNNLMKLTDRHGIRLNVEHQEQWFANAVVSYENGEYEVIQFSPMYSINGSEKKNFIENIYPNPLVIGKKDPLLVRYIVSEENAGELDIFSSDGRLMKKFEFDPPKYNYHILQWDGRNENGVFVSSGIYVLVLRVGNAVDIKKLAVIRN